MRKRSWFRRIELCVGEQMFGQSSGKATRTGVFGETDSGSRRAQARSACFAPSSRTSGWRDLCRPVASSHSARRRKSRPAHVCQPSGFPPFIADPSIGDIPFKVITYIFFTNGFADFLFRCCYRSVRVRGNLVSFSALPFRSQRSLFAGIGQSVPMYLECVVNGRLSAFGNHLFDPQPCLRTCRWDRCLGR